MSVVQEGPPLLPPSVLPSPPLPHVPTNMPLELAPSERLGGRQAACGQASQGETQGRPFQDVEGRTWALQSKIQKSLKVQRVPILSPSFSCCVMLAK